MRPLAFISILTICAAATAKPIPVNNLEKSHFFTSNKFEKTEETSNAGHLQIDYQPKLQPDEEKEGRARQSDGVRYYLEYVDTGAMPNAFLKDRYPKEGYTTMRMTVCTLTVAWPEDIDKDYRVQLLTEKASDFLDVIQADATTKSKVAALIGALFGSKADQKKLGIGLFGAEVQSGDDTIKVSTYNNKFQMDLRNDQLGK